MKASSVIASVLLGSSFLLVGCGSSDSGDAVTTDSGTSTATTITVERGRILNGTIADAAGQIGRETSNGQYVFDKTPTYPVSVTGGIIDVNNNGVIDAGEPFLTIPMQTYEGAKVTLVSTLIADADKTVRDAKLEALKVKLEAETGQSINSDDLLALPTDDMHAAILSNELYEAVINNEIEINDVNLTEMDTLLTNSFIVDFDTVLDTILADENLSSVTTEELAIFLEEETILSLGFLDSPTQEELDILSAPYLISEAMVNDKSIGTIILEKMSTPFGSSGFGSSLYADHTAVGFDWIVTEATWKVEDGILYIESTTGQVKMTFAAAPDDMYQNFRALFQFTDSDGNIFNDYGSFSLNDAANRVPTASAQTVTVLQDSLSNSITLSGEDLDGSALTYTIASQPTKGTLSGTAPNLTYEPLIHYSGSDSFTFYVNDGTDNSAEATVNINVTFQNTPPVAIDSEITVDYNSAANVITLMAMDVNIDDNLSYTIVTEPLHGTLANPISSLLSTDIEYTPESGYDGTDSFTYKANDGTDDSNVVTVTITVVPAFTFNTVTSPDTGRIWMDRNMGAYQVCTSGDDEACYGGFYQFGRDTDGHEKYNSVVTYTQETDIYNTSAKFVDRGLTYGADWTLADGDKTLRSAKLAKTDGSSVCPVGFRVPTMAEFSAEFVGASDLGVDLQAHFLNLPYSSERYSDGSYYHGESSTTWVTDVIELTDPDGNIYYEGGAYIAGHIGTMESAGYGSGLPIRCIQD